MWTTLVSPPGDRVGETSSETPSSFPPAEKSLDHFYVSAPAASDIWLLLATGASPQAQQSLAPTAHNQVSGATSET